MVGHGCDVGVPQLQMSLASKTYVMSQRRQPRGLCRRTTWRGAGRDPGRPNPSAQAYGTEAGFITPVGNSNNPDFWRHDQPP